MTRNKCKEMNVKDYFVKSDMDDDNLWPAIEKYISRLPFYFHTIEEGV